jgi:hypothetical protein
MDKGLAGRIQQRVTMAGHGDSEHGAMDISAHSATFESFWAWSKWGTLVCLVIAAVVVVIIA